MHRHFRWAVAVLPLLLATITPAPLVAQTSADVVPNQIVVGFRAGVAPASVAGATVIDFIPQLNVARVQVAAVGQAIAAYRANPGVRYAEPLSISHVLLEPNDTLWLEPGMYGARKVQAPAAWDSSTGSASVVVGTNDTGLDVRHPEFAGRIIATYDPYTDGTDGSDSNGHGTHVTGTAGATGNNATGIAGISWQHRVLAAASLPGGSGDDFNVSKGVVWLTDNGAQVINGSYGGIGSSVMQDGVAYAASHNVVQVYSAGNSFSSTLGCPACYHALYPGVISVGATDQNDVAAAFSNYGPEVEIAAPGVNILSTYPTGRLGSYATLSGTSMATPHVTGGAALLLAVSPALTNQQVEDQLRSTADTINEPKFPNAGRLNVFRAIGGVVPPTPTPTSTPTAGPPTATPTSTPTVGPTSTPVSPGCGKGKAPKCNTPTPVPFFSGGV